MAERRGTMPGRGRGNWNIAHGASRRGKRLPEYGVWAGMLSRCRNPRNKSFADYGGRGIGVCDRWLDFSLFYKDMGPRPTSGHSIERLDVNGGYTKKNCCWATRTEQAANKRARRLNTHCARGHEFTASNIYIRSNGKRSCRTCRALAMKRLAAKGYFKALRNGKPKDSARSRHPVSAT